MGCKQRKVFVLAGIMIFIVGCKKGNISMQTTQIEESNQNIQKEEQDIKSEEITRISFPKSYKKTGDRVSFQCDIEIPSEYDFANFTLGEVKEVIVNDSEKALTAFKDGREVTDTMEYEGTQLKTYEFSDGAYLTAGEEEFSFQSINSQYYTNPFINLERNLVQGELDFSTPEECEQNVQNIMEQIQIPIDLEWEYSTLDYQTAKSWEEHTDVYGKQILSEDYKESWSQEDDAYLLWAYQQYKGLPIFHETMLLSPIYAFDTPENAPIHAIYSKDGIVQLQTNFVYDIKNTNTKVKWMDFEDIAEILESNLSAILNETNYLVNRAKIALLIRLNEEQQRVMIPIWYFEILEQSSDSGEGKTQVMMFDAQTGQALTYTGMGS